MKKANTYFISDIHLGAKYISDRFAHERFLVQWLESIEPDCRQLFLVGDVLDYWFEYKHVIPKGYVRFFGQLARMSDRGTKITWLIGNHDIWIYDYLPVELGIEVVYNDVATEIDGKSFFISHGDGLGNIPIGFKILRKVFRNNTCRKLYSALHPRLTIPFALGWSKSSRQSERDNSKGANLNIIEEWAKRFSSENPATDFIVLGHYHCMVDRKLNNDNTRLIILGDWFETFSYGIFDGKNFMLKKYC